MNKYALIKLCKDVDNALGTYAVRAPISYNIELATSRLRERLEEAINVLEKEIAAETAGVGDLRTKNMDY